ncbi:MAG: hypothetical protein AB8B47_10615 [Roseobacter sp.]
MSDIVTNAEVEDVLSSIRRLVGDNKRPADSGVQVAVEDRFVLTPQLRVSESDVLVLQPQDAIETEEDWCEFEEPPLPEPYVLKDAVARNPNQVAAEETEHQQPALETPPSDAPSSFFELSAKIAALETAIAKTSDQWDPDGPGRDPYAGTQSPAMKWQDNVELDAKGTPVKDAADMPVDANTIRLAETVEEQIMDESALRDLVSEIVRSELQGDLGERITRNVRKLVRREIQRALTAQSLD